MYSNDGSMSTWGIFLFLLILFGLFGGNRCGGHSLSVLTL